MALIFSQIFQKSIFFYKSPNLKGHMLKKKSFVKLNKFYEENNAFCNALEKTFYTNEKKKLDFSMAPGPV